MTVHTLIVDCPGYDVEARPGVPLRDALRTLATIATASTTKGRPVLQALHVVGTRVYVNDSYICGWVDVEWDGQAPPDDEPILIDARWLKGALKGKGLATLTVDTGAGKATVATVDAESSSPLAEGSPPDYSKLLADALAYPDPETPTPPFNVTLLARLAPLAPPSKNGHVVRLVPAPDALNVRRPIRVDTTDGDPVGMIMPVVSR